MLQPCPGVEVCSAKSVEADEASEAEDESIMEEGGNVVVVLVVLVHRVTGTEKNRIKRCQNWYCRI